MTDFKPMLAYSKTPDLATLKYPVIIQPKLDGVRAAIVDGRLKSRTLKQIPNREIRAALERPEFEGLDGELIVGDPTAPDCYRRSSSFVMSEAKTDQPWIFYVFDKWNEPGGYNQRQAAIMSIHKALNGTGAWKHLSLVASVQADNADEAGRMEALLVEAGHEGGIIRIPAAPYKFGRSGKSGPLIKLKRFIDFEARIVGVYEEMHNGNAAMTNALGRTERSTSKAGKVGKGTLGGFYVVAVNGPAAGVEFKVGTGFDASQRADLWNVHHNVTTLSGRVIKVKSFPIGVKDKPRHPVFLGFRDMEIDG